VLLANAWAADPIAIIARVQRAEHPRVNKMPGILELLSQTWPARLAQDAWSAATLPRDVYQGRVDPLSAEALGRVTNLAMFASGAALPFARNGAIGVFGGRPRLPMDEASRLARAKAMGYADERFYRGEATGKLPNMYESGAHFSRDRDYASGFARRGGQQEPREFRLNLEKTFRDYAPVTAEQYGRLVESALKREPALASSMVEAVAPGKGVDWFIGFAKARPDFTVAKSGSLVRPMVEQSSDPIGIFKDAGFDALDSGRDVLKLGAEGIRLSTARFDPAKWLDPNIKASIAGVGLGFSQLRDRNPNPE
jgi:hypothetical protein